MTANTAFELVAIGGSTGGIEALRCILAKLPPAYPLALVVVLHQHRHGSGLANVLAPHCVLPLQLITDKDAVLPGRVHLCPPNYHLLFEATRTFALSTDAPVNYARPSIDVCLESAARVYRQRAIGVLLSGASTDGARGLAAIGAQGGRTICQDPETAEAPALPRAGRSATVLELCGSPDAIGLNLAGIAR